MLNNTLIFNYIQYKHSNQNNLNILCHDHRIFYSHYSLKTCHKDTYKHLNFLKMGQYIMYNYINRFYKICSHKIIAFEENLLDNNHHIHSYHFINVFSYFICIMYTLSVELHNHNSISHSLQCIFCIRS